MNADTFNDVQLMRTSIYTGGSSPAKMIQAGFYNEDCIVYDLEDSVSKLDKDAARFLVYCAIKYQRPANKYVIVRVNGLYSDEFEEDLQAIVRAKPDAIRIPKVEYASEVRSVDQRITQIEMEAGAPIGKIQLWCNIESYMGVINAREIAKASPRISAMALGAEDFTASMMAKRTKPGWEIFYARNVVLMACREAGISAQDAVYSDINDLEGLKADLEMTKALGFDGKTCVHPNQIDIVNACFTPSKKEIIKAERVCNALAKAAEEHTGVCVLDGDMVDKPMELRAKIILAKARAAGVVEKSIQVTGPQKKDKDEL
ncbi:HpcH/HpaI aldolase/citrate lyase family protein [Oribacterium sp. WCC10]|uniref:HpcH/HpaI aldolase/citrate lyase family protein n=1 Tax=Oribacterium sp. WCC10 TaxID=1855343 RepID=UPI0008EE5C16|nr:aldolase/citrate lyase family protein [Oribacterium sp. WCC10]SFG43139.1 citrate lyase subunit beta / citryl-CoA lyase [Oribacterium sp. WCC10]